MVSTQVKGGLLVGRQVVETETEIPPQLANAQQPNGKVFPVHPPSIPHGGQLDMLVHSGLQQLGKAGFFWCMRFRLSLHCQKLLKLGVNRPLQVFYVDEFRILLPEPSKLCVQGCSLKNKQGTSLKQPKLVLQSSEQKSRGRSNPIEQSCDDKLESFKKEQASL